MSYHTAIIKSKTTSCKLTLIHGPVILSDSLNSMIFLLNLEKLLLFVALLCPFLEKPVVAKQNYKTQLASLHSIHLIKTCLNLIWGNTTL